MGRGQAIDKTRWPDDPVHRALLAHLDKVHGENGTKSRRDIGGRMPCAASRVTDILLGTALPADATQVRTLITAMGGSAEDAERGVRLFARVRARPRGAVFDRASRDPVNVARPTEPHSSPKARAAALALAAQRSRARSLTRLAPVPAARREAMLAWMAAQDQAPLEVPEGSVRVLTGPMGAGKSEAAEQWWRRALQDAVTDEQLEPPVWFTPRAIVSHGLEETLIGANGIDPQRRCSIVLDDLDSVGPLQAKRLLEQARQITATWPTLSVLATCRPGIVALPHREEQLLQSAWPQRQGRELLDLLLEAGAPHHIWTTETQALLERPLTVLALAAWLNAGREGDITRTRILSGLARTILDQERPNVATDELWADLARLAAAILDRQRAIPTSFIPQHAVWRLTQTGLVAESEGTLFFALALFEQHFGAEAIRSGLVPLESAAGPKAFTNWRYAIATALEAAPEDQADADMAVLSRTNPAAASWILEEIAPRSRLGRAWTVETDRQVRTRIAQIWPPASAHEDLSLLLGTWLRDAHEATLAGYGPLRDLLANHHHGRLEQWGMWTRDGWLLIAAGRDAGPPALEALPDPDRQDLRRAGWHSWVIRPVPQGRLARWRWAQDRARKPLIDLLQRRRLPAPADGILARERVWHLTRYVVNDRLTRLGEEIPLDLAREKVAAMMKRVENSVSSTWQWPGFTADSADIRWLYEQLRRYAHDAITPPWPAPDQPFHHGATTAMQYSPDLTHRTITKIMSEALADYRQLVETNFPSCAESLGLYSQLPARITGIIERFEDPVHQTASGLDYLIFPDRKLHAGQPRVELELCTTPGASSSTRFVSSLNGEAPEGVESSISGSGPLPLTWSRPATSFAYQWLVQDLVRVGMLEQNSVRIND